MELFRKLPGYRRAESRLRMGALENVCPDRAGEHVGSRSSAEVAWLALPDSVIAFGSCVRTADLHHDRRRGRALDCSSALRWLFHRDGHEETRYVADAYPLGDGDAPAPLPGTPAKRLT